MRPVAAAVLIAIILPPGSAISAATPDLEPFVACAGIPDRNLRLDCFDQQVAPLLTRKPAGTSAPAPTAPVSGAASPPALPQSALATADLGAEQIASRRKTSAAEDDAVLHARINSQRKTGPNTFLVYLDNGQVWSHDDRDLGPSLLDGEAVTIGKAALGSYRLTRDAGKARNWIRVTRVR